MNKLSPKVVSKGMGIRINLYRYKVCHWCHKSKPHSAFSKQVATLDHFQNRCKECLCAYDAKRRALNPDRFRKYSRKHRDKDPEKAAAYNRLNALRIRLRRLGITRKHLDAMRMAADYQCQICGAKELVDTSRPLSVDHCHKTGKIRGLLCGHCNAGIGFFRDDGDLLMRAIAYLQNGEVR